MASTVRISKPKLNVSSIAVVSIVKVMPLPECGRMPWLAIALSPGQGERTSWGPGGDQWPKLIANTEKARCGTVKRMVEKNIPISAYARYVFLDTRAKATWKDPLVDFKEKMIRNKVVPDFRGIKTIALD